MSDKPEYVMIVSDEPRDLSDRVTEAMKEGFEVHGNPFVSGRFLHQAVVRFPKEKGGLYG